MADAYKGLTVKIGADTSSLSSALRKSKSEVSGVSTELRKLTKALKLDPGNTRLLAQQQEDYRKQIKATEEQLRLLKQAEKEALDGTQPMSSEQWRKLQSDIAMAEISLQGYKQALADSIIQQGAMNSVLGKAGAGIESFGSRIKPAGQIVESIGGTLSRTVTPAIIATGAATVAAAVDIDTSLTNVKKTVDGTDQQYQQLKDSAIEFSKTNAVSASQILDIQSLGAQLGFAIEELDEFGRVVSGLDIATNMDAEQAATEMAQFANITKMSHGDISNYGSAIVGLGNNFATTESSISSMAMRIAASGTQVGMSQADILGLATALSSMGIEAEAGGTAISTIMAQIDKDIAMNSDSVETWASTAGMSAQQFADAWKNDPVQALSALLSNMESATEEGGNMSVMLDDLGISSIRQTDVMKRLAGNSEFVADAVAKSNEEWKKNSALQDEVDNRNASLASQFEILKNRVIAMADQVGGPLAAALLDVIDAAEPLIQMIADGAKQFSEMSKSEQQAILKAVALSAALGPMLSIVGKGMQKVEGFGKGLQSLAKFFSEVDYKTSGASRGLRDFDASAKNSESATKKQTTAVKASSVAMGAAKTAALGVAGILAGMLLSAIFSVANGIAEAKKRNEEITAANRELSASLDGLEAGAESASGSLGSYGLTAESVKGQADDLKQAHADLAKSLSDTMTEAGATSGMLDSYVATIEELGTKSELTVPEQARLKDAIDRVNEACGTSFQMTDDVNGALHGQVDAIRAVVGAQQERLKYEAASEGLKDLYKQREEDLMRIMDLEQQRRDLAEKHAGQTAAEWGKDAEVYNELGNALGEARDQYYATDEAVTRYEARVSQLGAAMGSTTEDIAAFVSANGEIAESVSAAFESSGRTVDEFATTLSQLGVSTSELGTLTNDELMQLVNAYDGNFDSIISLLDQFGIDTHAKTTDAVQGATDAVNAEAPNTAQAMYVMKNGMLQSYDPVTNELTEVTADTIKQIAGSISGGAGDPVAAMSSLKDGVVYAYDPVTGQLNEITTDAVSGVSSGIGKGTPGAAAEASKLKNSVVGEVSPIETELPNSASAGSTGFAESLADGKSTAGANAEAMAGQSALMNMYSTLYYFWGWEASHNFARGIRSGYQAAVSAARDIANAVKDILGHSVPKEGPLRNGGKGEEEWGAHTVQNYVSGVQSQLPSLKRTMVSLAEITATGMGATAPRIMSGASQRMRSAPSEAGVSVTVEQEGGMMEQQVYKAVRAAMTDALARDGGKPVVLKVGEREFAREVRRAL